MSENNDPQQAQQQQGEIRSQSAVVHTQFEPPQLKVNGDIEDPYRVWGLRIAVILIVVTIFILKLALPPTFITYTNELAFKGSDSARNCNPTGIDANKKIYCAAFDSANPRISLLVRDLIPENQWVVFYFYFLIPEDRVKDFIVNQQIYVQAHEVAQVQVPQTSQIELYSDKLIYNQAATYKFVFRDFREGQEISRDGIKYVGYQIPFAYDRVSIFEKVQNDNLLVIAHFEDVGQLAGAIVEVKGLGISPGFTRFTIIVRAVYCFISLIVGIIYLRRYFQLEFKNRILEIRLVAFVTMMLFFFNDPFYAATVIRLNAFSTFFSTFHTINQFVCMLGLWVFFLRRILYEPEVRKTHLFRIRSSWQFYILGLLLYAFIATLYLQFSYYTYQHTPILLPTSLLQMKSIPIIILVALLLAGTSIYQLILFILILHKHCKSSPLPQRHKNYLTFFPFFYIMFLIYFCAGGALPYSYDGAWILYGYSFMNLLVYLLAYLYYTPVGELEVQDRQMAALEEKGSFQLRGGEGKGEGDIDRNGNMEKNSVVKEDKTDLEEELPH